MNTRTDISKLKGLDVTNPYDGSLLGTVSICLANDVTKAIDIADTYDYGLTAWQRFEILRSFCDLLHLHSSQISRLISLESGKTLRDAAAEVWRAHQAFLLSAEEAKRINGEVIPLDAVPGLGKGIAIALREPVGIVAAITPFNFPLNMIAHKVGPALAANNPVILKPSEHTPLTAMRVHELLLQAGLPAQMLNIVNGNPVDIVKVICADPRVRKISFTGSVAVGQSICRQAGMTRLAMELSGNDPMIVLNDADLDLAMPMAIDGAFGNNGQRCTAIKRFIVQHGVADEFIDRFVTETKKLRVGDQLDPQTDIGPLVSAQAAQRIQERVLSSVQAGAKLRLVGSLDGALMSPVVLDYVDMRNPIVADETFGPVAPFIRVKDFDEAISVANDTPFGLQSGVFTQNLELAKQAMNRIRAGAVMINRSPGFRAEHLPFGSVRDSGLGREGVKYAVDAYTQLKTVVL